MLAAIIINKTSGSAEGNDNADEIKKLCNENNIQPDIIQIEQFDKKILKRNYEVIAAAGGDGTIKTVASALHDTDIPLGVIPIGTHNHFAKDMKIPENLKDSIDVISRKNITQIDLGEVNGKYFVNNSAIGLYPHIVGKRKNVPEWIEDKKWLSMFIAFINAFKIFPIYTIEITENDNKRFVRSPLVFIGNNEYNVDLFKLGDREHLNEGQLILYYAKCRTRFCLFRLVFLSMFNKLKQAENFEMIYGKDFIINSRKSTMSLALDGELIRLKPPLLYRIHPRSLNVIIP